MKAESTIQIQFLCLISHFVFRIVGNEERDKDSSLRRWEREVKDAQPAAAMAVIHETALKFKAVFITRFILGR